MNGKEENVNERSVSISLKIYAVRKENNGQEGGVIFNDPPTCKGNLGLHSRGELVKGDPKSIRGLPI